MEKRINQPEFPKGSEVSVLAHGNCIGTKGKVEAVDDFGNPILIKCKTCAKPVMLDRKQTMLEQKQNPQRNPNQHRH